MKHATDWRARGLDILLFLLTIGAVAGSFLEGVADWIQTALLLSFVVLFCIRWRIDENSRAYIRENWFDLVFVVLLASPILRLFTALRFVRLMPAVKIGALLRRHRRRILRLVLLSRDSFPIAMALVFGIVFLFGTSVFMLEHGSNPGFKDIQDGLWWAFVTLTTVGYGDIVPRTEAGRIVAVMLMVFGVAVYSLMVANLTHFLETIDHDHIGQPEVSSYKESIHVHNDSAPTHTNRND